MTNDSNHISNEILNGSIGKTTIKLMIPILIGEFFIIIYGLTDSFFISLIDRKSTTLISALGIIFPIYFFFTALSIGLSNGISSLVARSIGAKDKETLDKTGDSGLTLSIVISILSIVLLYLFSDSIVKFLSPKTLSGQTILNAKSYLYYLIPGIGFLLIMQTLTGILQGEGLMQFGAIAMLLSVLLNIILDPVFIFVFKLGISGASLATTISMLFALLFVFFVFLNNKSVVKIKFKLSYINHKTIKEILRVGAPQSINMILLSFSFMIINYCVGTLGEDKLNAWSLVGRMDEFILMIGYALAGSTLTLSGQNYGNRNIMRVKETFRINSIYGVTGAIILAIIYNIFAYPIFNLLTGNKEVLEYCVKQVRFISFSYTGIVVSLVLNSLFIGTGKPLVGFIFSLIRVYFFLIPACLSAIYLFHVNIDIFIMIFLIINLLTLFLSIILGELFLKKVTLKENNEACLNQTGS